MDLDSGCPYNRTSLELDRAGGPGCHSGSGFVLVFGIRLHARSQSPRTRFAWGFAHASGAAGKASV